MKWPIGTDLWMVQIRYWEEEENPIPVRVVELLSETDSRHLKVVYHSDLSQEVYVPEERCFSSKENAIKAAKLLSELQKTKLEDESNFFVENLLESFLSIPPEKRQFADRALSLPPVKKMGNVFNGYIVTSSFKPYLSNQYKSQIYWDLHSAEKAVKQQKEEKLNLEFEVIEVKVCELKND
jgi:hypothetical protein